MPIPAIKGIYQRSHTAEGQSSARCQKLINASVRRTHGIVNLLDSALYYVLTSNYSVELEIKSNTGSLYRASALGTNLCVK